MAKCSAVPSYGGGRRCDGCVRPGHRRRPRADPCGGHGQSAMPRGFPAAQHPLESVRASQSLPSHPGCSGEAREDWYWRRETPSHHSLTTSPEPRRQTPTAARVPCLESCELPQLAGCRVLLACRRAAAAGSGARTHDRPLRSSPQCVACDQWFSRSSRRPPALLPSPNTPFQTPKAPLLLAR